MSSEATQVHEASARYLEKADAQCVPPGYKWSDAGIIPDEWATKALADVCTAQGIVRGPFGGALKKEIFVTNGFKVYEQRNAIYKSCTIGSYFVDQAKYAEMHRFSISPSDFIISCSGTIGRIYQLPPDAPRGIINQALLKLTTNENVVDNRYFYVLFEWDNFQKRIIDSTQGGAMKNLVGMNIFKTTSVVLPPLPEQRAIAEALSDVDRLLGALAALIAKKRAIKQAAMQQLLTGKTRLPGFSGEWETKRIGEFTDCTAGGTPSTLNAEYWGGPIQWMNSGELNQKIIHDVEGRITEKGLRESSTKVIPPRCVLIGLAGQGKTRGTVAMNLVDLCMNQSIAAIFPSDAFVSEYLYFNLDARYDELRGMSTGDGGRGGLNLRIIRSISVPFPLFEEQTAISAVLSDMDAEITALEHRRDKTKQIKQGMMQHLLTGRVRLVKPAVGS